MKKVMVLGSFVVDLMGRSPHLPEHGETVKSSFFQMGPGGKGFNQAVAAKRAGADLDVSIKLGRDEFAAVAVNYMKQEGMDTKLVRETDKAATGAALIMVDEVTGQNMISVYLGSSSSYTEEDLEFLTPYIEQCDYLLMQLEINLDAVKRAAAIAKAAGARVILNPAPAADVDPEVLKGLYAIVPNEVEARLITGITVNGMEDCQKAARWFRGRGVENVIITLGRNGVYVADRQRERLIPINPGVEAVDTTGAGDAFCGGLLAALGEEKDIFQAAAFGNLTANLSVTRIGTAPAMPFRQEIDAFAARLEAEGSGVAGL